jgi:hypothetical protein
MGQRDAAVDGLAVRVAAGVGGVNAYAFDWSALEAAGLCECGQRLDSHDPLAKPKPWSAGRPCSKTSLDRGHGWDGRPTPTHGAGSNSRWSSYGTGLVR